MENSQLQLKKILGIDYGRKYTGLATYKVGVDPYALMWGRIKYESDEQLIKEIQLIIEDEFIDLIALGVPYFTDGKSSTMTKTVQDFANKLAKKIDLPIHQVDETLTTFEAQERMKNSPRFNFKVDFNQIDALCATIIIEEFLAKHK
ncbi:MAG: Holliday junction resolvase RuvX [Halobacteriovoraceae bacterium]|nr:Holliday junction resolvase RuvX [Halobacteriovoraceae bacterium]|tara:strand:+ start:12250 stop:12690 length:441 start_codon:yes stop_codon:yes gene_type:complete